MDSLRTASFSNTELPVPVWSGQDNKVLSIASEAKQKNTGSPVNGMPTQRKRKRTLYSKWQQVELESVFEMIPYPDISTREHLAKIIRLPEAKVQIWFQNRRARKNKSGKLLYRRGSSLRSQHLCFGAASPSQDGRQRNALIPMSLPPNEPIPHRPSCQYASSMQQAGYPSFHQVPTQTSEQFSAESDQHDYSKMQDLHWPNVSSNPEYGCGATMYNSQQVDLESFTIPSQGSYWEMFPQAMNENGSQTSLGYISDVIYNAAILTNLSDL